MTKSERECCVKCKGGGTSTWDWCVNKSCPCHTEREWEIEFVKQFAVYHFTSEKQRDRVISFIKETLSQYRERLKGEIEGMRKEGKDCDHKAHEPHNEKCTLYIHGKNSALNDLLTLLK